jgi:hypothetical protein
MYEGFAGYSIVDGNIVENTHAYGNTPTTDEDKPIPEKNNLGWINRVELESWRDFYELITLSIPNEINNCSVFDKAKFVNGLKYNILPSIPLCVMGVVVDALLLSKIRNEYGENIIELGSDFNVFTKEFFVDGKRYGMILLLSLTEDNYTFSSFQNRLSRFISSTYALTTYELFNEFKTTFNSFEPANVIVIPNSVVVDTVKGPSKHIDEMTYYKNDGDTSYVIRYDGKLKPNFVNQRTIYFKDYISDDRTYGLSNLQKSIYGQYVKSGFEPLYKSIGYNSILSTEIEYDKLPNVKVSEHVNKIPLLNTVEYKWFNDSIIIPFVQEHNIAFTIDESENVKDSIKQYLMSYHNITNTSVIDEHYIYDKYNVSYNWEYHSLDDVQKYDYKIKLRLK